MTTAARLLAGALAACVLLALSGTAAIAGITGSKHDFSAKGWGSGEICVFCHTPHNANRGVADSPLWNHELTAASYVLYVSPTLQQTPLQPRGPSKLCLSCHDGTVAVDSFGARPGAQFMTGSANLGTDLSNDHPVSVYWNHQTFAETVPPCTNCHSFHGPLPYNLPFFQRYVECSTCHEPHGNTPEAKMLRRTRAGSALCLHCHGK